LVFADVVKRGFNELNNVIWQSDLSVEDKANLDAKLETRKSDVGQWQENAPKGPEGLKREIPDIMLKLKETEFELINDLIDGLEGFVKSVLSRSQESMEIKLIGGGVGSVMLNARIRERLEGECIRITSSESVVYSYATIYFISTPPTQLIILQMSTCPYRR
jgi:hypothetical protein